MPAAEPGPSPELLQFIELASHPDALHWAHECGWVPGTGHCRQRDCASACLFRPQREAEAGRILRIRRRRNARRLAARSAAARAILLLVSAHQILSIA
jgi:hypothetical protein